MYPKAITLSGIKHDKLVKIIHLYLPQVSASYNVIEKSLCQTVFGEKIIVYFKYSLLHNLMSHSFSLKINL